jgi:DNA-directed RNA polymerase subunit omega
MARITIEDCLTNLPNMYELVILATQRARQIFKGSDPLVDCKNKQVVTALREIAEGYVLPQYKKTSENGLDENDIASIAN